MRNRHQSSRTLGSWSWVIILCLANCLVFAVAPEPLMPTFWLLPIFICPALLGWIGGRDAKPRLTFVGVLLLFAMIAFALSFRYPDLWSDASGPFAHRVRVGRANFAVSAVLALLVGMVMHGVTQAVIWFSLRNQPKPGFCNNCGYDLTGNVSRVCPECGMSITNEMLPSRKKDNAGVRGAGEHGL